MVWLKLDDQFTENRKVEKLTDRAFRFHVAALCYCARLLTDGHITEKASRTIAAALAVSAKSRVEELVAARLWTVTDDGWLIRDFLDYNPSAEDVAADRARNAQRQREYRARRNAVADDIHDSLSNGARNALRNRGSNDAPSRPVPFPVGNTHSSTSSYGGKDAHASEKDPESVWQQIVQFCEARDDTAREKLGAAFLSKPPSEFLLQRIWFAVKARDTRDPLGKALSMLRKEAA